MPTIIVNNISLEAHQVKSVRMYVQITRERTYKQCDSKNAAKQIIDFMRNVYLADHPFDELDFADELFTKSEKVANLLVPTKADSLSTLIEIAIDFNNMIALGRRNYTKFFEKSLQLSQSQSKFIESKTEAVINRLSTLPLALERKPVEMLLIDSKTMTDKVINSKSDRAVEQYTTDGVLIATFPNVRTASVLTHTDRWCIYNTCKGRRKTANGFVWKFKSSPNDC